MAMKSKRGHIPASFEKSPKTSIYSNQTDRFVPQPFTFVDCIAKECLIEIGQRFEVFAKYVDELGKEIEEDGECLFKGLTGLCNETFDEAEEQKLKRFEALYYHFFHAAATRGGANGGVVKMTAGRSVSNVVWER